MGQRLAQAHLMPYTGLQYGVLRLRTLAEQLSRSFMLLGFVPMHSDSQQFVRVASWFETFTAVTRVEPFLLKRLHLLGIGILAHLTTTCVRQFLVQGVLV
jgi:hypothetical protein